MSVAGAPDADRFVASFAGAHPDTARYLIEDVLRSEPPEVRRFLQQTAVLDTLSAPLCDAVTGRTDGQRLLESLVKKNLFTFGLDERRTWFRFHHLFLEVLRERLEAEPPGDVAVLHDRASEWFEGREDLPRAVHHALAGKRFRRAARLLERAGREDFRQGNFKELRRSVEALPDEIVRRSPTLCVLHGWALAYTGELSAARERIASAETALLGAPAPLASAPHPAIPLYAELQVLRTILRTIEYDEPGATAVGPEITAVFPDEERALRAFAAIAVGYGERARGELDMALAHFREAVEVSDLTQSSFISSLARLNVGVVNHLMGRSREAKRMLTASLERARSKLWVRTFGSAILHFAVSLVLNDEGRPAEALQHLSEAIEILEAGDALGFIGIALVERARTHAALGGAGSSVTDLARAREVADVHGVRRVAFQADLLEARLAMSAGDLGRAAARLESAAAPLLDQPVALVLSERQEALRVEQTRFHVAEGRSTEAVRLAGATLKSARAAGRRRNMVELLILQALAWSALGDGAKAADKLGQALHLVEGEDVVRPFVEAGAGLVPLLRALRDRPEHRASAERLLGAVCEAREARTPGPKGPPGEPEVHPDDKLHLRESQNPRSDRSRPAQSGDWRAALPLGGDGQVVPQAALREARGPLSHRGRRGRSKDGGALLTRHVERRAVDFTTFEW